MQHLLIIEDDKVDQLAFERFAKTNEFSFTYQVVNTIYDAKQVLEQKTFDAVVSDYFLGDGTAFEILDLKLACPVVIVTGTGSEEVAVNALKKGAFDYLIKDIDGYYLRTLEITVKNAITRYNTQIELNEYHHKLEELVAERTLKLKKEIKVRKNAEKNLKKLTVAVEQSSVMILITDLNANIEYVNPKFTEVMGYTLKEIQGKTPSILKSGHHPTSFYKNLWNTIKKGESFSCEMKNLKKDGSFLWENANITSIKSKNGKIINYLKIAEDITEKRQINFALKESEKQLSEAQSIAKMGSFDLNIKTQLGFCSNNFFTITQIPIEKPLHFKEWRKLMHPDDVKTNNIVLEESINNGYYNHEFRIITKKTKQLKWLKGIGKIEFNKEDNCNHLKGVLQDITSAKKAKLIEQVIFEVAKGANLDKNLYQILKLIQEELGKLLDTTNFYVALYNATKNVLEIPYMKDDTGIFKEINFENSITAKVLKAKKPLILTKQKLHKIIKTGEITTIGSLPEVWLGVPLLIKNKAIGVMAIQNYTNPNAFSENDIELLEYTSTQISQSIFRKQQEENLKSALKKAKESDRLKTAFLHNMSHEIRTPMNGIIGFSNLLKNENLSSEKQQKYINVITKSSNRLLNTLNDLMDISKLETGQITVNITKVTVYDELKHLEKLFSIEAANKNLTLTLNLPNFSKDLTIETDNTKIIEVLTNLIKNAIKYSNKGEINFGCNQKPDCFEFYVKDEGIGIPENRQKAIFERFVQADIEDKNALEGSGLGLSISKSYIELLNGKIWVKSAEGKGSQFFFSIPNNPLVNGTKNTDNNKENTLNDNNFPSNLKVLIAEDELYASMYLEVILEDLKCTILKAENGLEAVELYQQHPDIDLILMDIKMPQMDGIEATKIIRKTNKDIAIIAQSAYTQESDIEKTLNAGCNEFIPKPVNRNKLIKLLKHYFNK